MSSVCTPAPKEPKWCLVITPPKDGNQPTPGMILALTEDCLAAARERGWVVLALDSEVLGEPKK